MASNISIDGSPATIATLEHPIDREHGCIHASVVERLQGSKKRKRSEIAVAVDNSGIKIYDVGSAFGKS